MKSKKSQATMEFLMTYSWAILVVLVAIGALAYFGVFSEKEWCLRNLDRCVCEEWETEHCLKYQDSIKRFLCYEGKFADQECKSYRKKTECELNPDGEDCFCEEYKQTGLILSSDSRDFQKNKDYLNKNCILINEAGHDPDESMDIKLRDYLMNEYDNETEVTLVYSIDASIWLCEPKKEGKFKVCLKAREKTDLELFSEKLKQYDCKKLALDFTEDCFTNCKYNYYDEYSEVLKEYFLLKGCKFR